MTRRQSRYSPAMAVITPKNWPRCVRIQPSAFAYSVKISGWFSSSPDGCHSIVTARLMRKPTTSKRPTNLSAPRSGRPASMIRPGRAAGSTMDVPPHYPNHLRLTGQTYRAGGPRSKLRPWSSMPVGALGEVRLPEPRDPAVRSARSRSLTGTIPDSSIHHGIDAITRQFAIWWTPIPNSLWHLPCWPSADERSRLGSSSGRRLRVADDTRNVTSGRRGRVATRHGARGNRSTSGPSRFQAGSCASRSCACSDWAIAPLGR